MSVWIFLWRLCRWGFRRVDLDVPWRQTILFMMAWYLIAFRYLPKTSLGAAIATSFLSRITSNFLTLIFSW